MARRAQRQVWPAHPALSRPLTVLGVERGLFMLAVMVSYIFFKLFSAPAGAVMLSALYAAAFAAHRRDPQLVRIVRANLGARRRYDPGLPPAAARTLARAEGP